MSRKQTSVPRPTVQASANRLLALLEDLHTLEADVQINGDLRQVVADAWLQLGEMEGQQHITPEGWSDYHRHFVQQARAMEYRKRNPSWTTEEIGRFRSMLWAAADESALLRPMDVGRVFENARKKQADEEQLRQWLLTHSDLPPRTRRVLETGMYAGQKAF